MKIEESYRLVFEKNPHPMWIFHAETLAFLAVNDAAVNYYGYSREEFLAMTASQICAPEEAPRLIARCRKEEEGGYCSGLWRHRKKDGSLIEVEMTILAMPFQGRQARLAVIGDTTRHRQIEASLVESEARLRTYLESASEGLVVVDREGRIEYVNAKTEEMFGYTREELIGQRLEVLLPERFREIHTQHRVHYTAHPRVRPMGQGLDLAGRRKDGSEFPVEVGLSAVPVEGGVVQIGFINDITIRKQAEDALRESEQRFRHLVETSSDQIWQVDTQGVYTYISPHCRKLVGYEPEEMLGRSPFDFMAPAEAQRAREFFRGIAAQALPFEHFENAALHKSGRTVMLDTSGVPYFDQNGMLLGYRGIDRDITERRRAEEALRRSKASLARAQEMAHLGNWEEDAATGKLEWSEEVYRIFHLPMGEPMDRDRFLELVHPDDRTAVGAAVQAALSTAAPYNIDHRIVLPDGTVRHVREHAETVRDKQGALRLVGTVQDITEYKQMEEQLRHSHRMEAIGRLAGGVAHDFNNLLTIIGGYSELLAMKLPPDSDERRDLDEIVAAAGRAVWLTRQLLAFSRRQILQLKIIDLNAVVRNLDNMLRRLIGEDVQLNTRLAADLGAVKADPAQIEQVIMNLAVNARDAMPQGGNLIIETCNVDLDENYSRAHPEVQPGPYVMLAASDDGIGMTAEIMAHIFEPFYTTKPREKGTGLGLSTVYGIVKQSGGSVFVYSEPGRGATFKIYLPRVEQEHASTAKISAPTMCRGEETILVVEDEAGVRMLIRAILEAQGYTVLDAPRGRDAIELLRRGNPAALMITDVVMPEMSGRELAESARAVAPHLKVLYMSGYTDEAILQHGILEAGIPFLQKPFTQEGLVRKIREVLDSGAAA